MPTALPSVRAAVGATIRAAVRAAVRAAIGTAIGATVRPAVGATVRAAVVRPGNSFGTAVLGPVLVLLLRHVFLLVVDAVVPLFPLPHRA